MLEANNTYIYKLMAVFAYDYFSPDGREKIIGQQIVFNTDLNFSASTSINYKGLPLYEYSFGLGYALCKNSFAIISNIYGKKIEKFIQYPFNDYKLITYDYFSPYINRVDELDNILESIINDLSKEYPDICYYWLRCFEYSFGFIMLHEFGHYINGHSEYLKAFSRDAYKRNQKIRREYHIAELQSDIFAIQFIFNSSVFNNISEDKGNSLMVLGGDEWLKCVSFSVFSVFILLEKMDSSQTLSTHPRAIIRIGNAMKHIIRSYGTNDDSKDFHDAINFSKNLLDEFSKIGESVSIDVSNWKNSVLIYYGGEVGNRITLKSDTYQLILLQMHSQEFRYKLRQFSRVSIKKLNSNKIDRDILELIVLSGNHIPWAYYNKISSFVNYAFYLIDFTNQEVIYEILDNEKYYLVGTREEAFNLISKQIKSKIMIKNEIENQILNASHLEIHELFTKIGTELHSSGTLRMSPNDSGKNKIDEATSGKLWFDQFKDIFQKKICDSNLFNVFVVNENKYDKIILCASIADLISGICIGVSPIVVAMLIIKTGLNEFCDSFHHTPTLKE